MKYRPEIDGLRALAVVPVILFHAGFEFFNGGFIGVDVFFVISGYLITTILVEDLENKRFSIAHFYERRARRILPALFLVMTVCIPFAWMWMLPDQMKNFSQSLVAVSLFASNVLFWRESGYFDAAAEEKPLLHTWSLAVEEQYYVLFPIFLFLAWRLGKNRVFWMIVAFAAISLVLSEWGWRNKATGNFYLAPTRAWELFSGSIAAFIIQKRGVQNNNTLSLFGLALVLVAFVIYDEATPFPSFYTLLPIVGVVLLVLFAGRDTFVAKLLGTKAFVGIGLISYSAYLWHQPLFAFARIRLLETSPALMGFLSLLSLLLAFFSWKYIENYFRRKDASQYLVLTLSAVGLITFIVLGFLQIRYDNRDFEGLDLAWSRTKSCSYPTQGYANVSCDERKPQKGEIIFIGDSLLNTSLQGISQAAKNLDTPMSAFPKWACPALIDTTRVSVTGSDINCAHFNEAVFRDYFRMSGPHHVVLFSAFNRYLHNGRAASIGSLCEPKSDACISELEENLKKSIAFLKSHGHQVYLIEQPPRYEIVGIKSPNNQIHKIGKIPTMKLSTHAKDSARFYDVIRGLDVPVFNFRDVFCDDNYCTTVVDNQNYYINSDHFGTIGAARLVNFWESVLLEIASNKLSE